MNNYMLSVFAFFAFGCSAISAEVTFSGLKEGMTVSQVKSLSSKFERQSENVYCADLKKAPAIVNTTGLVISPKYGLMKIVVLGKKKFGTINDALSNYVKMIGALKSSYGVADEANASDLKSVTLSSLSSGRHSISNLWRVGKTVIQLEFLAYSSSSYSWKITYQYPSFGKYVDEKNKKDADKIKGAF